jgi:hypothetical protein
MAEKDVDQARAVAALGEDLLAPVFLTETVEATDELELEAVVLRDLFGVGADGVPQGSAKRGESG